MRVCKVEDHFFHHQADTHGCGGVLLEGRGGEHMGMGCRLLSLPAPPVPPLKGSFGLPSALLARDLKRVSVWGQGDYVVQLLRFHF